MTFSEIHTCTCSLSKSLKLFEFLKIYIYIVELVVRNEIEIGFELSMWVLIFIKKILGIKKKLKANLLIFVCMVNARHWL